MVDQTGLQRLSVALDSIMEDVKASDGAGVALGKSELETLESRVRAQTELLHAKRIELDAEQERFQWLEVRFDHGCKG